MTGDQKRTAEIKVECYAGSRAEELPRSFCTGNREIEVNEIIDRWLDPAHSYFKVRGDDGGIYILRYDQEADFWELIMFDSGTRQETRLSSS